MNENNIEARNELGGNYRKLEWTNVDTGEKTYEVSYTEIETGAQLMRFFKTNEQAKMFAERLATGSRYKVN